MLEAGGLHQHRCGHGRIFMPRQLPHQVLRRLRDRGEGTAEGGQRLFAHAIDLAQEHFAEQGHGVIAELAGVHEKQLCRIGEDAFARRAVGSLKCPLDIGEQCDIGGVLRTGSDFRHGASSVSGEMNPHFRPAGLITRIGSPDLHPPLPN